MSAHIAYALVAYTLALIFLVSPQMESKGMSILPYFILVVLVAAVIIPCRNLERRWQMLDRQSDDSHNAKYTREIIMLWVAAIGLPTLLMLVIWIIP